MGDGVESVVSIVSVLSVVSEVVSGLRCVFWCGMVMMRFVLVGKKCCGKL